jgi:microcystin degradation protein MlrC
MLKAEALSGGEVTADTYAHLKAELLDGIAAALPLDGFLLDIHGAMSVIGIVDAEADLAAAIRDLVGPDCLISASMDLHGNVTADLVDIVDLFTCYRHAPHIDVIETRERAFRNLIQCLDDSTRPHRAWVRIPVMLPGERTTTLVEPAKSIYAVLAESDTVPGVIDPSLWVGFVWADHERSHASVVVTGTDPDAIKLEAETIARRYWDARHDFVFGVPAGDPDWVISEALALGQKAVFISDSGDNPTAGAAGDTPYMLERLLDRREIASGTRTAIMAAIPDPAAVAVGLAAGIGELVTLSVGGKLDPVHGSSMDVTGRVQAILTHDPVGGDTVVVGISGVALILTSRRKVFFERADFEALDLDVDAYDLVVVKVGYLFPGQQAMASASFMALSPGAVSLDIPSLPYLRVQRPIFPLDPDMPDPDLTARIFGR